MYAVLQRVAQAQVKVDDEICGRIDRGLLLLLGVEKGDQMRDLDLCLDKILALRIFPRDDCPGGASMDANLIEVKGACLVVSQFTLAARIDKGRRPSFDRAEHPERARELYESFISKLKARQVPTQSGRFGAHMKVQLTNDGPVTILMRVSEGRVFCP